MQTNSLPSSTCNSLERCFRDFLWGNVENRNKPHLVKWEAVCKPKQKGGLGIRHLKDHNKAILTKMGWGLIKRNDDFWAKVIKDKYKCRNDIIPVIDKKRSGSSVWSGIKSIWGHVSDGIAWRLGDGQSVRFWTDKWIPNIETLDKYATTNIPDSIKNNKVADYTSPDSDWNWQACGGVERSREDYVQQTSYHMASTSEGLGENERGQSLQHVH